MDRGTHEAFMEDWSSEKFVEAEVVTRIGTYGGNASGKQLADLTRFAHRCYPMDDDGPVHTAVRALYGNGNTAVTVSQVRRVD
jgi:hypothetical protein